MAKKRTHYSDDEEESDDQEEVSRTYQQPSAKKRSKPVKKVAVWKDIKKWKKGDDPLGRFPIEVLNLIISIDTDSDLRDHLALSGVCRFFETCYRDVVFQVLFQDKHPEVDLSFSDTFVIGDHGLPTLSSFRKSWYQRNVRVDIGPTTRSLNEARNIMLFNGKTWNGWGIPNDEWNGSAAIKDAEDLVVLKKLIAKDRMAFAASENAQVEKKFKDAEAAQLLVVEAYEAQVAADQALEASTGDKAPYRWEPQNPVSMRTLGWAVKVATTRFLADVKKVYGDQVVRPAV